MRVRVEWKNDTHTYIIGITKFLEELGVDVSKEQIEKTVVRIQNRNGFDRE